MCMECEEKISNQTIHNNEKNKEGVDKDKKIRKVFLDDLPRWENRGLEGKIDWKKSIGYKVKGIYEGLEFEIEIIDYKIKKHTLYLKYEDKEIFKIHTSHFKDCKFGKLFKKYTNRFKIEIGQIFKDDKRDLIVIDKEYREDKKGQNHKWYKYKCNNCGWDEGWIEESALLKQEIGCSCCANRTVVEGINNIPTVAPWMVKYFQGGYDEAKLYTKGSHEKIIPICPNCGHTKNKLMEIRTINRKHSIGCLYCSDGYSYPFKLMFDILKQLDVSFKTEYSPEWCKYMYKNKLKQGRYDFYFELKDRKYIVEMDGGWHKEDNLMSGQTAEESQTIDDEKDRLGDEHGIKVIRIDCIESDLDYIKNNENGILNSKLAEIFDLSTIDWNLVEEFALSNLVKKACKIKKDNPEMTCNDIGKIIGLHGATIIRYLKKGSKIWNWCNYDPKEENRKIGRKNGKSLGKKVEVFKEGKSLGIFNSCHDLDTQSEKIFEVKLNYSAISSVCNNKYSSKSYKGFTFKYVDNNNSLKSVI